MAAIAELARSAGIEGPSLAHLQRLVASWDLLADLSFADLLLFVPVSSTADGRFLVLDQVRPTTSQTLYREDQVGRMIGEHEHPVVMRAWALGQIIDGDVRVGDEIATVQ